MKEPLKEVPVELIRRLNWMEGHMTDTCRPYAEALRDLIEDWKRLKEEEKENTSERQKKLDRIERLVSEGYYDNDEAISLIRNIFDE